MVSASVFTRTVYEFKPTYIYSHASCMPTLTNTCWVFGCHSFENALLVPMISCAMFTIILDLYVFAGKANNIYIFKLLTLWQKPPCLSVADKLEMVLCYFWHSCLPHKLWSLLSEKNMSMHSLCSLLRRPTHKQQHFANHLATVPRNLYKYFFSFK